MKTHRVNELIELLHPEWKKKNRISTWSNFC